MAHSSDGWVKIVRRLDRPRRADSDLMPLGPRCANGRCCRRSGPGRDRRPCVLTPRHRLAREAGVDDIEHGSNRCGSGQDCRTRHSGDRRCARSSSSKDFAAQAGGEVPHLRGDDAGHVRRALPLSDARRLWRPSLMGTTRLTGRLSASLTCGSARPVHDRCRDVGEPALPRLPRPRRGGPWISSSWTDPRLTVAKPARVTVGGTSVLGASVRLNS